MDLVRVGLISLGVGVLAVLLALGIASAAALVRLLLTRWRDGA